MNRICVYCGSSAGSRADYASAATELGEALLRHDIGLVYGGASKGLMGILADTILRAGGQVTGIIPEALLKKEVAHPGLTDMHVVDSMHERKSMMADLSDAFIAMPGGFGTIEETVEALTWGQLMFHDKPCGLLNVVNYFDRFLAFLDHAVVEGFLKQQHRQMLIAADDAETLLTRFGEYQPPAVEKWREPPSALR